MQSQTWILELQVPLFSPTSTASTTSPVSMPAGESPSRSMPATLCRISASDSVATLPGALSVVAGLRGSTLPRSAQYVRGSLRATSSRYTAPPSLSKDSISASLSAVVVLFCVPFGRPVCIRLASCAGDAISDMALLSIEPDSRFPFLLIRTFCAFPTCQPSRIAPTLHQLAVSQRNQKPINT